MATAIKNVVQRYNDFLLSDKYADPTTIYLFLANNPLTMIIIIGSYLYFCLKCGPKWMEKRKPFELRKTLIVYNALQVLFSIYIAWKAKKPNKTRRLRFSDSIKGLLFSLNQLDPRAATVIKLGTAVWMTFDFWCALSDYTDSPQRREHAYTCWLYFFAKITELLDTVLFVLRKKNNQISFLHVFHHTLMPIITWVGLRYFAGGHATLFGVINSYVHIAMYSYYLIAALGPEYRKYLWWKRHLTEMQLIQFLLVFVHNLVPLFSSCTFPKGMHVFIMTFACIFIYLFGDFYTNTYLTKKENVVKKD